MRSHDGKKVVKKQANRFAQFVKENYAKVRETGVDAKDTMKVLAEKFKKVSIIN